jgi:hypothetical protein
LESSLKENFLWCSWNIWGRIDCLWNGVRAEFTRLCLA